MKQLHIKLNLALTALIFLTSLGVCSAVSDVHATSVPLTLTVNPTPVLQITIDGSDVSTSVSPATVSMNVTPGMANASFVTSDLNVTVGTSSSKGYKLNMYASSTNLTHTVTSTYTIPTLGSGSYVCTAALSASNSSSCTFTTNRWGYRLSTDTANTYKAMVDSTNAVEIASSDSATNGTTTSLTFGARVGAAQPAGAYTTTLNFIATANPEVYYMQTVTASELAALMPNNGDSASLVDNRDTQEYTVAKINGNYWMTQNLRLAAGSSLTYNNSNVQSIYTSASPYIMPTTSLANGSSYVDARTTCSANTSYGCYYNYCAASAEATCTSNITAESNNYDICPKGWRLPTSSEFSGIVNYKAVFNPVKAGGYSNGILADVGSSTVWWSSNMNVSSGVAVYVLLYSNDNLSVVNTVTRQHGYPIRCIKS